VPAAEEQVKRKARPEARPVFSRTTPTAGTTLTEPDPSRPEQHSQCSHSFRAARGCPVRRSRRPRRSGRRGGRAGHLRTLIPGQGPPRHLGHVREHGRDCLDERIGAVPVRQVDQPHRPTRPVDQSADRRAAVPTDDQSVALPVADPTACLDDLRSTVDQDRRGNEAVLRRGLEPTRRHGSVFNRR
jgi:hypothetical protein